MLYAKRFIQRRDVKAVQFSNGGYSPDRELKHLGQHGPEVGFQMHHLHNHLNGVATYGHYLLDQDDMTRLFAFDIDLAPKPKATPENPNPMAGSYVPMTMWDGVQPEAEWEADQQPVAIEDLRLAWLDRAHPARPWLKYQMGMLARRFTRVIQEQLGIGTAAAYSGNKGIHVYGFTGAMPATQVRDAALWVLDMLGDWQPVRGNSVYGHKLDNPSLGYQNFTIEVFPKQTSLKDKDLGNLMRLPLGRNLKSPDPTFFLNLNSAPGVMEPHPNPVALLETGDPYQ